MNKLVNKPYESRRLKIDQDFLPIGSCLELSWRRRFYHRDSSIINERGVRGEMPSRYEQEIEGYS
jgi:hypothetical protein